jgi:hypothetical protein
MLMSDDLVKTEMFDFLRYCAPSLVVCCPVFRDSIPASSSRVSDGVQDPIRMRISTAPLRKPENWKRMLEKGGRTLYKDTISIFAWTG